MQKRRHLEASFQQTDPGCSSDSQPHAFLISGPASPGTSSATSSPLKKEQPLFTLRQVGMICERLLKEREEKVREEYEEILNTKLAEQYDAFVKFTHDQIMRRYGEQPASFFGEFKKTVDIFHGNDNQELRQGRRDVKATNVGPEPEFQVRCRQPDVAMCTCEPSAVELTLNLRFSEI
ncbi:hypothetical protein STEG23_016459 [Scotinomys teguina]